MWSLKLYLSSGIAVSEATQWSLWRSGVQTGFAHISPKHLLVFPPQIQAETKLAGSAYLEQRDGLALAAACGLMGYHFRQ